MNLKKIIQSFINFSILKTLILFLTVSNLFFGLFGLLKLDYNYQSWFLPHIKSSSEIVVVGITDKDLQEYGQWPWDRGFFSDLFKAISEAQPKVLALDILFSSRPEEKDKNLELNRVLVANRIVTGEGLTTTGRYLDSTVLSGVKTGVTEVNIDVTGKVRNYNYLVDNKKSLAYASLESSGLKIAELKKPYTTINPNTTLPKTLSISNIKNQPGLMQSLKDKFVFFGSNSSQIGDFYNLPRLGRIGGVFIHAMAFNQLYQNHLYDSEWDNVVNKILILLAFSFYIAILSKLKSGSQAIWFYFIPPLIMYVFSLTLAPVSPSLILSVLFTGVVGINLKVWQNSFKEKHQMYNLLKAHLSPTVLNEIVNRPDSIDLGGQKYDATIMFTDIRGFTKMSEKMDPKVVGEMLNLLLGMQAEIVLKHNGVVDKFIGDSVMAWWGDGIVSNKQHAELALNCALEINQAIKNFNSNLNTKLNIKVGIGLDSGVVAVGNFGSQARFNFTAIGDAVNTASRVESLNKNFKSEIIFTERVLSYLTLEQRNSFKYLFLDKVRPRGKKTMIDLYRLISKN